MVSQIDNVIILVIYNKYHKVDDIRFIVANNCGIISGVGRFLAVFVSRAGIALGILCQYSVMILYISRSLVKLASPVVDYGFLVGNSRPVLSTRYLCSRAAVTAESLLVN